MFYKLGWDKKNNVHSVLKNCESKPLIHKNKCMYVSKSVFYEFWSINQLFFNI